MPKKLSPKQLFLLLYLSTVAFGATVYLLFMRAIMSGIREPPDSPWSWFLFFLWPFGVPLVLLAIFFVVVAMPRFRIALAKIEIPKEYSLKHFLLLMWLTAQAFLMGVVLHNGFYGLGMIAGHITPLSYLLEGLHVAFFFIALFVVPASFALGAIGRIWDWAVAKPVEEMKTKGIQLPSDWRYFAPLSCYGWLWRFGKGIAVITEGKMGARRVFAAVFLLGVIGFVIVRIVRWITQRRLAKIPIK